MRAAVAEAAAANGDIEVLVNNVASDQRHKLEDVTPDYYEDRMAINERLAFFVIQAMVLFLASDDAEMCTAQEFLVDAGWA